jgi:diguanylate cyclase (GGDEF)-like protein
VLLARRAPRRAIAPAAAAIGATVVVAHLLVDGADGAASSIVAWGVLVAVGAGVAAASVRPSPTRARGVRADPDHAPGGRDGESSPAEIVELALATVMRATDAHEAALWRAEADADGEGRATLLARVAAPDIPAPESPVPLAGHPIGWAIDERHPQRIERGRRALPSPWAAEMLLVPVDTPEGARVLALAYPGVVPPGAEPAAVRAGQHLAALFSLLRTQAEVRRSDTAQRVMVAAVHTLPAAATLVDFARNLAASIVEGTGASGAAVAIATGDGRGKVLHVAGEQTPLDAEGFGEADSRIALVIKHGVPTTHPDLRRERVRVPLLTASERWGAPPRSAVLFPLKLGDRVIGAVAAWHAEAGRFGERQMEVVSLLCTIAPVPMESAQRLEGVTQTAATDALTGLANRRTFDQKLLHHVGFYERYARPFAVLMLDVDSFKRFNDTYGHEAGDRVLKEVAAVLRSAVRDADLAARMGGEEFVVLLPEAGLRSAAEAAERIRRMVEVRAVPFEGRSLLVTVSIGVAAVPDCTDTAGSVLALADAALYRAKEAGRNRVYAAPKLEKAALE